MNGWRVVGCDPANIRIWDDEAVVFSSHSGSTHVLSAVAGETLFALIEGGPADAPTLCRRLAERHEIDVDDSLTTAVDRVISEMDELGLITEVPA
ncbi:MAG: HPr-rel-A system PqqD family peptide chaperone [Alphaproteobacteria bacterium]|nr:HPr-rel-A system PqqD family peptide chaperone [Alphaproteobacteria bacterium]